MQSSLFASTKAKNLNPFANITSVISIMNALRPRTMNSKSYAAVIKCGNEVFVTVVDKVFEKMEKILDTLIRGNKVPSKRSVAMTHSFPKLHHPPKTTGTLLCRSMTSRGKPRFGYTYPFAGMDLRY
jgi:hypothetical protein